MASKPCNLATCRQCRPGRPCAESIRWESEEDRTEEVDRVHDEHYAATWNKGPAFWDFTVDPREELFATRTWLDACDSAWKTSR